MKRYTQIGDKLILRINIAIHYQLRQFFFLIINARIIRVKQPISIKCHLKDINPENMKKKNHIIPLLNKLIFALIALLGFSCDPKNSRDEYGSPEADFKVNGTIVDEVTLNKLSDIQVIMEGDTILSDENGNYEVGVRDFPTDRAYLVSFKDVDGELNNSYSQLDTIVEFENPEFENGDGWYSGETSKQVDIKLTPDK